MRKKQDPNFILALSDFWKIILKGRKLIVCGALFFSLLTLTYAASKSVLYQGIGTYREKGIAGAGVGRSSTSLLSSFFGGSFSEVNDSETVSVMKSRRLMSKVVEQEHLQAQIIPYNSKKGYVRTRIETYLNNIKKNFLVEYAYFMDKRKPIISDDRVPIYPENVIFYHETPLFLLVKFVDDDIFQIKDMEANIDYGMGRLNVPFVGNEFQLTILAYQKEGLVSKEFVVILWPLENVAESLSKLVTIEVDKEDKSLIKLKYKNTDRFLSSYIINSIMDRFQDYLKLEHHRLTNEQLSYLQKRQKESNLNLRQVMEEYAAKLSSELSSVGFANSQKAMEFLAANQHTYRQKQLLIEQEIKRYEKDQEEGGSHYARFVSDASSPSINNLVSSIREMRLQSDNLDLTLRQHPLQNNNSLEDTFKNQLAYLSTIQDDKTQAEKMLDLVSANRIIPDHFALLQNPDYMVGQWNQKLAEQLKEWKEAPSAEKQSKREACLACRDNFETYLKKLIHLLEVYEKTLQERITHLHLIQDEYQGIDLHIAKELFLQYSRDINILEATMAQQDYIISHMQDSDFEISSLATVLVDSVSREMIQKASNILLALRDENNRSQKEQERLKEELRVQRGFILLHLKQTNELHHLRSQLLRTKSFQTQKATLALIQQQITVLEQQLADHIDIHINNLKQEREILQTLQLEIKEQMAKLPSKWVDEQFVDLQVELNQRMGKEITNLVESKNINSNLELIQSSPMDIAYPPIHPQNPRLIFFAVVGVILGVCFSVGFITLRAILKGLPASEDNLKIANQNVCGTIHKNSGDLEPLRHLLADLTASPLPQNSLLLLQGNGFDYSKDLAELMSKMGEKVILLPIFFDQEEEGDDGLLQYLEGAIVMPKIRKESGFWIVHSGGKSLFGSELLNSKRFHTLYNQLLQDYDWVIGVSRAKPLSGETEILLNQFQAVVFNVTNESLRDLSIYFELDKRTSFIFTEV